MPQNCITSAIRKNTSIKFTPTIGEVTKWCSLSRKILPDTHIYVINLPDYDGLRLTLKCKSRYSSILRKKFLYGGHE